jgi:hypothetical protein
MSQGDIYSQSPIWLPPRDVIEPWDITAGEVMVLTASCWIDKQRDPTERLCLVAPVLDVGSIAFTDADKAMMRDNDCLHQYMYLPPESDWPERVVMFLRAHPIRFALLERCPRQAQLTYGATQQLMRKLTMFYSTAHLPASQFLPISDDFPDGID